MALLSKLWCIKCISLYFSFSKGYERPVSTRVHQTWKCIWALFPRIKHRFWNLLLNVAVALKVIVSYWKNSLVVFLNVRFKILYSHIIMKILISNYIFFSLNVLEDNYVYSRKHLFLVISCSKYVCNVYPKES